MIINLIKLIFLIKWSQAEFMPVFHPFQPPATPLVPICSQPQHYHQKPALENVTSLGNTEQNLKFLIPFLDMQIDHNRNVIIMQETVKQQIFILHGQELYQLFISRQEKRISLMGLLQGSIREVEPLGAQIIYWQGHLILVIAVDEHLEVYQLPYDILKERAKILKNPKVNEPPPLFEAIQQLTLMGKFQQFFLFSPVEERIMIIATANFTKLYGKYRSFEWLNTYFDPVEDLTLPIIHLANVIGLDTKYFIPGHFIKHQSSTILTVYEISQTTLRLQVKQTLMVHSKVVHIFSYRKRNMIVACSGMNSKCSSFRQDSKGLFNVYRQRSSRELAFDLLVPAINFVGATRQNQIMIFTNHRLDCYASISADSMHVTNLMGYFNADKENYVLLVFKNAFQTLIRIIELEINVKDLAMDKQSEPEEKLASTHHKHLFEATVGQLRSVLIQRKMEMDVLRKVSNIITPKIKEFVATEPVTLHSGNVGVIKIIGKNLRSPLQILKKAATLRQIYAPQRAKRSNNLQNLLNKTNDTTRRAIINKLKVKNLIYAKDVIEGFHHNVTNEENPILHIKPRIRTHAINSSKLLLPVEKKRMKRQANKTVPFFNLNTTVRVQHLKVDFVNGVHWNEFLDLLFLKNRDKIIQGRLVMQSQVNINHLQTTVLNGLIVSNLFNLKHPQFVHSELMISSLFVRDLKAETINGLIFEEDIVFNGNETFIETPVIINQLRISGDLFLADNTKVLHLTNNTNNLKFKQSYTNRVIINGSLSVNNLKRGKGHKTKFIVGNEEYNENHIKTKYLLREESQNFSFPIIFDGSKVTASHLETNYLHDHITEQHMLVNVANEGNPLHVVFMNASIEGDVICQDHKSKIAEIKENIIHRDDKIVNITGIKVFEAPLEANELNATHLNHKPVTDFVFKSGLSDMEELPLKFKNVKTFLKIKVKNPAFIGEELEAAYLNTFPLEDLFNHDYYMDSLQVPYLLKTSNIFIEKINGIQFRDFNKKFNFTKERFILHKDLIIEGNAEFKQNLELKYLNNIYWNEYVDNLARNTEIPVIEGDVTFSKDLVIQKEFATADINGFDLEIILKNVLLKSKPQLISGLYYFNNINTSSIDVLNINNVNVNQFIDLSQNFTEIKGDIIVETVYVQGNLQAKLVENENYNYLKEQVLSLPLRSWKNIVVLNSSSWPSNLSDNSQQDLLKYLYKTAVKAQHDQIITGNVKLTRPLITKMQTSLKFPADVDIDFIQKDSLLKNSSMPQIVKGVKIFSKSLYVDNIKAHKDVYTKLLNNIDVLRFNQSLYRITHPVPIQGHLQFLKPLTIKHLQVNGFINGLSSALIYELHRQNKVPAVKLNELFIDNTLTIKNINDMNFEYFLDNRVTLEGAPLEHFGTLTFENLIINTKALIQSINNIAVDNLVFKYSDNLQTITGHKKIAKSLELAGPAHVIHLNDKNLIELYKTSLLYDQNYQFDNLIIDKATFEQGLQVVSNLNTNFQARTFTETEQPALNNKQDLMQNQNLSSSKQDTIYLDYDLNVVIKWKKPENVFINKTILYGLFRKSPCEKVYLEINFQNPHEIYIENITSNHLSVITDEISVRAENYCRHQQSKVKSKITISGHNLEKVFGMNRFIETIHLLNIDNSTDMVIVHALDLPSLKRNEIRLLKILKHNQSIYDWQGLTENIGEQLKLFKLSKLKVLITNGLKALTIYHFNDTTRLFEMQQKIPGDYDIIEMFEMSNITHLILSCTSMKCPYIFMYEYISPLQGKSRYQVFQIISIKLSIDNLLIFSLQNELYMLVLFKANSIFYSIYKYSHIEGWLHISSGYFFNLQKSIPLTALGSREGNMSLSYDSNGIPLLLLCNFFDCNLVKAIV